MPLPPRPPYSPPAQSDAIKLQTTSPLHLEQEIESAQSIDDLALIHDRIINTVEHVNQTGADIRTTIQLIAHFNDSLNNRIPWILREREHIELPEQVCYLALGSKGRREQTLRSDQDSAIIHGDNLSESCLSEAARFARRFVEALEKIGVPRCPGNTMASNPAWSHSLSSWKSILEKWIFTPEPNSLVNFSMFQDLRCIHGNPKLETELKGHILFCLQANNLFLPYLARHIVRFTPPLGLFGRIQPEKSGEHPGKINLKRAGIFAITQAVSLLGLEKGIMGGNTWEKLERLQAEGVFCPSDREATERALSFLVQLRLRQQLADLTDGNPPSNYLNPKELTAEELSELRTTFRSINLLLKFIRNHYQLDFIAR